MLPCAAAEFRTAAAAAAVTAVVDSDGDDVGDAVSVLLVVE